MGNRLLVQYSSPSAKDTNPASWQAQVRVCFSSTAASLNLAKYDHCWVEKFLAAFTIFCG